MIIFINISFNRFYYLAHPDLEKDIPDLVNYYRKEIRMDGSFMFHPITKGFYPPFEYHSPPPSPSSSSNNISSPAVSPYLSRNISTSTVNNDVAGMLIHSFYYCYLFYLSFVYSTRRRA